MSRRALFYQLHGLSFREYLNFNLELDLKPRTLDEILSNPIEISLALSQDLLCLKEFRQYLQLGYYPFFKEDQAGYHQRIKQVINTVLENDIPSVYSVDYTAVQKIKKLLSIISELVPFKPNVTKLSQEIGLSRESLIKYLKYLEKAEMIDMLYSSAKGMSALQKPEKIYLNNTNMSYALMNTVNVGNARETFFVNQMRVKHAVTYPQQGDFIIDNTYTFEVGGKNKTYKQIADIKNSWIALDNTEIAIGNKIPLWLFGFLY